MNPQLTSNYSPHTILPHSLAENQAVEFIKLDDVDEISAWKKSAQTIANNVYQHQITYTTNVFVPLTFLCRNACDYCGFRHSRIPLGEEYLKPEKIEKILETAKHHRVSEVLITMGDKPEKKYPNAQKWLLEHGFNSTVEYIYYIAEKALTFELLPHINAGTLAFDELRHLREVSASMGLMLETISSRLTHRGLPHAQSPDKNPKIRMTTIKNAGTLKIPFTSGILVGIGETPKEIVKSLFSLKNIHEKYHHLQEVIIQNFQPQKHTPMENFSPPSIDLMEKIIIIARYILPPEISIQIPPNLIQGHELRFIEAGISDWGGISSITHDYINPGHKWPPIAQLTQITREGGYRLRERLPVYPSYLNLDWLSSRVYNLIRTRNLVTKDGYRKR